MSGFLNVWAKKVHIVTTQLLERVENFSSRVRVVKRKSSSRVPSGTLQGLIITYALGEHDPGSAQDWRTSNDELQP